MQKIRIDFNASLAFNDCDVASQQRGCDVGEIQDAPRFTLIANSGSRMRFGKNEYVIALDGVATKNENGTFPVFMGHDWERGIGHAYNLRVENNQLIADGVVSRETEFARDFVTSSLNGFPWQASVGGWIEDYIDLREGESLNVNGVEENGPCIIATKFVLMEVSVVEYGADSKTLSQVEAKDSNEMTDFENNGAQPVENQDAPKLDEALQASLEEIRAAQVAEIARISEIRKRANVNDDALVQQAIEGGWSPDKFELESLRASRQNAPAIHKTDNSVDKKALEAAFVRAAGIPIRAGRYTDAQLTAADKLAREDFRDIIEAAIGFQPTRDERRNAREWIQGAFDTENLGSVLSTNANAVMLEAFDYANQSWRGAFKVGTVNDFKASERWRLDSDFAFKETPATGEFEHGELGDERYTIQAKTYGRQLELSYQSIVNGEALNVFGDIMRRIAFGASEAINNECWSLFMNPGNSADSKAFYHADHGSLKTSCALTLENLSAARAAFVTKTKAKTNSPMGMEPEILVVPTSLEDKALMLTKATTINNGSTVDTPADWNPNAGRFQVLGVPYLEYSSFSGYSSSTWYLLSNPNKLAAFEIAFLFGQQSPVVRSADIQIGRLGISFDGHIDFGVAREDYRGIIKCTA